MSLCKTSPDYQVLLDTVFAEAGGQPEECQRAVAWVIKNRVDLNRSYWGGGTIAGVCLHPGQFECWTGHGGNRIEFAKRKEPHVVAAIEVWLPNVFLDRDPTNGSDYYNNLDNEGYPPWINKCRPNVKIGNFQFYKGYYSGNFSSCFLDMVLRAFSP